MGDDEIIKRRLLIDGDGTGEARIMTKFMKSFVKWCSIDEAGIDNQVHCDRLLTQLSSIESSSIKWSNVIRMNEDEDNHYDLLQEDTNKGVLEACKSITTSKEDLEAARKVRCNRMEYDALARLINEHPPRSDTANKLKLLNQELNSIKIKRDSLEQRLNMRRKQLHVLVTALHQLQQSLEDDATDDLMMDAAIIDLTSEVGMDIVLP